MSVETLMAQLRFQVEFYFSPKNLSRDTYLRNLLSQYGGATVPLSVICNFPKVRNICTNFNVPADPHLVMRSLEGSTIVYVTPDAAWISPMLPLPPLDPNVNLRPVSLGLAGRSLSVSSMPDMSGRPSAPGSPVKTGNGTAQQQGSTSTSGVNGSPPRPAIVDRSQSHSGPVHYTPTIPISHPLTHGIPVAAPGYAHATYNYPFRNVPPPPGNYPQAGYVYPPMQGHPSLSGAAAMQYPQIFPGYTYVGTTVATGPHKYFQPGNPVLVRGSSANSGRPAPHDGNQKKTGQPSTGGSAGGRNNKSDGAKQSRKVRNRKGVNEQTGASTANLTRRGSKDQLKQLDNAVSSGNKETTKMTRNRSQNDMSDSSGGAQTARRKNKNKNKVDETMERREDVTFDVNQFPALSPSSPVKAKDGSEKPPIAVISGYAAALLAKNKVTANQNEDDAKKDVASVDQDNTGVVKGVADIKLNAQESKSSVSPKAATNEERSGSGTSDVSNPNVSDKVTRNSTKATNDTALSVKKNAKSQIETESEKLAMNGPITKDSGNVSAVESKVESTSVQSASPPLEKHASTPPAPLPTWGNKLSFIDVVRKQV